MLVVPALAPSPLVCARCSAIMEAATAEARTSHQADVGVYAASSAKSSGMLFWRLGHWSRAYHVAGVHEAESWQSNFNPGVEVHGRKGQELTSSNGVTRLLPSPEAQKAKTQPTSTLIPHWSHTDIHTTPSQ